MKTIQIPKEITKCNETDLETASFGYYEGIRFAKDNDLKQSTSFSEVRKGTHFIVCCGDVMVKVESNHYPNITRRNF
tara:strand:- start:12055 stop:12285 length:231 start_codon:yes stop_codon:yes gene_type:complete